MFDTEMRYLAVSRRWVADYRLRGADVIGRSHDEVFPGHTEPWQGAHRRGLEGEVVAADARDLVVRADSDAQWVRWEVRPWHTDDGGVGGIVVFTEDITERKLAEKACMTAKGRCDRSSTRPPTRSSRSTGEVLSAASIRRQNRCSVTRPQSSSARTSRS